MFRNLYNWTLKLAEKPYAPHALAGISFAESSFFPVPPDVVLLPMCLAKPEKALFYALICTISSVLGGMVGYAIGYLLYDTVGAWLITTYGLAGKMEAFREAYQAHGHWVILLKGLTPIPFKLVTITSGLAGYNFGMFVLLSIMTRGLRFFMVAGAMHFFGEGLKVFIEKNLTALAIGAIALIVGGIWASKYLL